MKKANYFSEGLDPVVLNVKTENKDEHGKVLSVDLVNEKGELVVGSCKIENRPGACVIQGEKTPAEVAADAAAADEEKAAKAAAKLERNK